MTTKPVRVLYEIHPHTVGGTERFMARFLAGLDRRRYEPLVVSQKRGGPLRLIAALGVRTAVISDYFEASGTRRLAEFIRRNRVRLAQSNYYSSNLATAANLAGVPHVWRPGGHIEAVGRGARARRNARLVLDLMGLLSEEIICNSQYVRSQFRGLTGARRVRVIPNGIVTPARASRKKRRAPFRVGMVAHLTPLKRHEDFIRAAELVCEVRDDVSFEILGARYAGASNRRYAAEVLRRARGLERQGKLRVSEFTGPSDGVMGRFDLVVLPSVRESFSNAILEAMAEGVPVVAARSGGNAELVEHRVTGLLVSPLRPDALARAVLRLIKNPELMKQMGEAARLRARTRFSLKDCVRSYEAVYSRVLARRE